LSAEYCCNNDDYVYNDTAVTLNNASDYRANGLLLDGQTGYRTDGLGLGLTLGVRYSPLVR